MTNTTTARKTKANTTTARRKSVPKKKVVAKRVSKRKAVTKKTTTTKKSVSSRAKGTSKFEALRQMFSKKGVKHSIEEIEKKTGFDHRNALTAISILKSEARTAVPMKIERNIETGMYVRK